MADADVVSIRLDNLEESVKRGSANAALVVTKVGCSSAMPDSKELNKFINQQIMET